MRNQPWKYHQIKQYSKEYSACIGKDIERVKSVSEDRVSKILGGFHKAAKAKDGAGAKGCRSNHFVLEQTHQQEQGHWQQYVNQVAIHENGEGPPVIFTCDEVKRANCQGNACDN